MLHLHRSNRTERLADALCEVLLETRPADPFERQPVVVGSRGMERWLRHELATRADIAAGLAFPFPRQALAGATLWLLGQESSSGAPFWEIPPEAARRCQRWERDELAFRLVGLLRDRAGREGFELVSRYLGWHGGLQAGPVSVRELLFAGEVADVLDRLAHERPDQVFAWTEAPDRVAAGHRWLAELLDALGATEDPYAPASLHRSLQRLRPRPTRRCLCVFGLSTLGPGDRARLAAISRFVDVHLFVLTPTRRWPDAPGTSPILDSLGGPSRDLHTWLDRVGFVGDRLAPMPPSPDVASLLGRLQAGILEGGAIDGGEQRWPSDGSIALHRTWGALRQCEVLRDELLAFFADDPTLEPRDVLVMTPDIETFAPLVAGVFSRTGGRLPRIPVSIADLGLRRTNPVAGVLLHVLQLAGDRLCASALLELLSLEPVRLRWRLDDEDVADLRVLVRESGLRWGLDAADRVAAGQPAADQNTARFALERLALGVLMPDEEELDVVPSPAAAFAPAVPLDVEGSDRVGRVGQLIALVRCLGAHRSAMERPAPLADWRRLMGSALDELTATDPQASWLRVEVDEALDELGKGAGLLGELPVERAAVLRWLEGRFELPQRGDRPITGAVQVCALEPMRSVPFRVVALLGMDDRAFPRGGRPRTWDPMAERLPGERDRREIDRHLLLEALLSARDRVLVLWSGHDVQQGRELPAAVPVEELAEILSERTGAPRDDLVTDHPLQPWSVDRFREPPRSFDPGMAHAALTLRRISSGEQAPRPTALHATDAELPAEALPPEQLELDELAAALLAPHRLLLRDRLGLAPGATEPRVEDREPLELDTLESWSLRSRLVRALKEQPPEQSDEELVEALRARVAGEGLLPARVGGRALLAEEVERARRVLSNLASIAGVPAPPIELSLGLDDGFRLVGRVDDVVERRGRRLLQWHTPSSQANHALRMTAWLHLLAARAAGHRVEGARLVGHRSVGSSQRAGGEFLGYGGSPARARSELAGLVAVWRSARRRPLPLFRRTSAAVAEVLERHADLASPGARVALSGAVARGWSGGYAQVGDAQDPWIRAFFVEFDPTEHLDDSGELSLVGLARRVWLPVVRALRAGRGLGAGWLPRRRP